MSRRNLHALSPFELIEQAVHLLRTAPAASLATYAAGTLPFTLGFIYFLGDMSRSAFALRHMPGATLGMSLLYLWMKFTHAIFAAQLSSQLAGQPGPALTFARCRRIFFQQAALQPAALFLLPLAFVATVPFGWVYAFFQSLTAVGGTNSDPQPLSRLISQASRQAALWPRQNHLVLLILSGFSFLVFLNYTVTAFVLPGLVRSFFGMESMFTLSGWNLFNTTFFAVMFGLTFASVAPIFKAVYVLRCFYGESLSSGEDLKAELRRLGTAAAALTAAMILFFPTANCGAAADARLKSEPANSESAAALQAQSGTALSPVELDRTVKEVLAQRKYAWRLPRDKAPPGEDSFWTVWMEQFREWLADLWRSLVDFLRKFFRIGVRPHNPGEGYGWITTLHLMLYVLAAGIILALALILYRAWRTRRRQQTIQAQPVAPSPDVADENVGADQLPEDGWMRLASELLERGELRLALRALYLGSLAHLASRNLVTLARFKSNRDYERELQRRSHAIPGLLPAFKENVSALEAAWYGRHPVDQDLVARFRDNFQQMKGAVG